MATKKSVKPKHHIATGDLYGNPTHCTAEQWVGHIIDAYEGHPEMAGREHDVRRAVEDPDVIRPSTLTGKALAFERVTSTDIVRVIVYYTDQSLIKTGRTMGVIATAYPDDPAYISQVGAPIYTKTTPKKGGGG